MITEYWQFHFLIKISVFTVYDEVFIHSVFDGLIIWNLQYIYRNSECNSYEKVREDLVPYRLLLTLCC